MNDAAGRVTVVLDADLMRHTTINAHPLVNPMTTSIGRDGNSSEGLDPDQPLRVVLIGTDFEVRVWETLLKIPMGRAVCYSDIANKIQSPKASRAVGAAVGRNPVSFVVPCHRALGKGGALTGYHWGITRKQAMLGWEAGQVGLH